MTNINVYDLCSRGFKVKGITLVLTTHFLETSSERTDIVNVEDQFDTYQYRDYNVVMFTPTKKGHLEVYGYREV